MLVVAGGRVTFVDAPPRPPPQLFDSSVLPCLVLTSFLSLPSRSASSSAPCFRARKNRLKNTFSRPSQVATSTTTPPTGGPQRCPRCVPGSRKRWRWRQPPGWTGNRVRDSCAKQPTPYFGTPPPPSRPCRHLQLLATVTFILPEG